ncbi:MAG TPA: hypothetical protein VGG29_13555 [Caulobacteraceae bacterium]|jgi:hypothetical protein
MIRILSLAAAAAALAVPVTSFAQGGDPAFGAFQKICWSANGDYVGAVKAADADGWKDTQVIAPTEAGVSLTDKAAREKPAGSETMTLLVTRGLQHTKGGDFKVDTCKLTVNKADAGLIDAGKAWLGGVDQDNKADKTLAVYYVKLGGASPEHVGAAGVQAAMDKGGGFGVLKFQADSDAGILVFQAYTK